MDGSVWPLCKGSNFTESWKGRIIILSDESEIAKELKLKGKGEFAVKVG